MRGDKIRTYRLQDDLVTDHRTGKQARWKDIERGNFKDLIDGELQAQKIETER